MNTFSTHNQPNDKTKVTNENIPSSVLMLCKKEDKKSDKEDTCEKVHNVQSSD